MPLEQPFSKRHRYAPDAKEITVREDAPENLRYYAVEAAGDLGVDPSSLREIICRVLRRKPDPHNWSEYPNIWGEVQWLTDQCEWFRVYDIIEAIHADFARHD